MFDILDRATTGVMTEGAVAVADTAAAVDTVVAEAVATEVILPSVQEVVIHFK